MLQKNPKGARILGEKFNEHEGRLKQLCTLERTGRNVDITRDAFINLYPYLPYQIDLCIDIVSGLRLRRGIQWHIGGSNRTIIKQAQQMLVSTRRLTWQPNPSAAWSPWTWSMSCSMPAISSPPR